MKTFLYSALSVFLILPHFVLADDEKDGEATKEQKLAVLLIEGQTTGGAKQGTGFACVYKDKEFVATNLHVIDGVNSISIKPQSGDEIRLSGKVVVAGDADICLLGIVGEFSDYGIVPLFFMDDVFAGSKAGDEILCLGNTLGGGVITTTTGTIKAFGQPRLEIVSPVAQGNSGGPIIHKDTGKVVGLVTEAVFNDTKSDRLAKAAKASQKSDLDNISYFGHRVDSVKKWSGTTIKEYQNNGSIIENSELGLDRTLKFFADEEGWKEDRRIVEAWNIYQKFLDVAASKTTTRVETTRYVNEFGVTVRSDSRIKGHSIAQSDYDKARETFCRSIEWKIKADKESLERVRPIGYRQLERTKMLLGFSDKVLMLQKDL